MIFISKIQHIEQALTEIHDYFIKAFSNNDQLKLFQYIWDKLKASAKLQNVNELDTFYLTIENNMEALLSEYDMRARISWQNVRKNIMEIFPCIVRLHHTLSKQKFIFSQLNNINNPFLFVEQIKKFSEDSQCFDEEEMVFRLDSIQVLIDSVNNILNAISECLKLKENLDNFQKMKFDFQNHILEKFIIDEKINHKLTADIDKITHTLITIISSEEYMASVCLDSLVKIPSFSALINQLKIVCDKQIPFQWFFMKKNESSWAALFNKTKSHLAVIENDRKACISNCHIFLPEIEKLLINVKNSNLKKNNLAAAHEKLDLKLKTAKQGITSINKILNSMQSLLPQPTNIPFKNAIHSFANHPIKTSFVGVVNVGFSLLLACLCHIHPVFLAISIPFAIVGVSAGAITGLYYMKQQKMKNNQKQSLNLFFSSDKRSLQNKSLENIESREMDRQVDKKTRASA